ncbi:Protein kinase domain-containing protein [Aix galericulata]|nr:Protein kinase domain-containing protein [Aix galericulata]
MPCCSSQHQSLGDMCVTNAQLGHLQPRGGVPLDQRLGKGRSVTLSPVMPGSPSGCSAQPRGSGGGRGEAVHGCLSCATGEGERLGTD